MAAQTNSSAANASSGRPRQLLALGGGGFTVPEAAGLDDFALSLTGTARPRVGLIPTASGDASAYIAAFYRAFGRKADCSHVSLFIRSGDVRAAILEQDLLYIGGGNTANLLALWRLHGLDAIVAEAFQAGVVLVGVSAGACALFSGGVSASFGSLAPLLDGLGLISGAFAPHWSERGALLQSSGSHGWGATDMAGLHFVDGALQTAVGVGADAEAFRVEPGGVTQALPVRGL